MISTKQIKSSFYSRPRKERGRCTVHILMRLEIAQPLILLMVYFLQVFLVGKDFGALVVYLVAVLHPTKVSGVVTRGIPFLRPGPNAVQSHMCPKGFYVTRWKEPGRAEADFGRFDVKTVIKNIYILFSSSEVPAATRDDEEIMDLVDPSTPLPPWLSEEDLAAYASLYENSGFRYPLQVPYRTMQTDLGIPDPKVTAPSLLIMGEKDYVLKFPGMEDYMRSGQVKHFVPNLDIVFLEEGNHFIQEMLPQQVNELIVKFLNNHMN
ncbi:hypothetical protein K2173_013736 [Erythroxylum novogranatense]|uniref:Epoxide hydrolase n=1 Tax=Erythroxylum novogranatense TaxID=1862640 RepID=A0AAV8SAQ7_9ROSI|nr:hypothetical protein K2173_013736 [Erythroxylum novogranatense]